MNKTKLTAGAAVAVAVLAVFGMWRMNQAQIDSDKENLKQQRIAAGMPMGMPPGMPGGMPMDPKLMQARMLDRLTRDLTLTDAQKEQVRTIQASTMPQIHALFEDRTLPEEQKREKIRSLHEEQDKKIKAILTSEQQSRFEEMRSRRGGPGGPGGPPPDGMPPGGPPPDGMGPGGPPPDGMGPGGPPPDGMPGGGPPPGDAAPGSSGAPGGNR